MVICWDIDIQHSTIHHDHGAPATTTPELAGPSCPSSALCSCPFGRDDPPSLDAFRGLEHAHLEEVRRDFQRNGRLPALIGSRPEGSYEEDSTDLRGVDDLLALLASTFVEHVQQWRGSVRTEMG